MSKRAPKWATAQEAIGTIRPDELVFIGEICGEPQTLAEALIEDRQRLSGLRIIESRRIAGSPFISHQDSFHITSVQVPTDMREAVADRKVDFLVFKLSESEGLFSSLPLDVALIQVSPPDNEGYCSLGVAVGFTLYAALNARRVIAEVNQQMPRTCGRNLLHLTQLDYLVESSRPLLEYPVGRIGPEEMEVGKHVAELIPDGATICTGVGAVPEATLLALKDKRHIGVHSGMITEGFIDLIERGVITNQMKNIDVGKTITALVTGSERLFRFVHNNPQVEVHPYGYTHDIKILERLNSFTGVNSAIEIDLTGQVNAETLGGNQLSAVGGQADFTRGAALSSGGKSIIALTSATRGGQISKIVPEFREGTVVTTPRYDTEYVVTEYGIAYLKGKTTSQRAEALISIAHPKFREQLSRAWLKTNQC